MARRALVGRIGDAKERAKLHEADSRHAQPTCTAAGWRWLHHVKMLQPLAGCVLKESARPRTVSVVEAGVVLAGVVVGAGVGVPGEPAGAWLRDFCLLRGFCQRSGLGRTGPSEGWLVLHG